MGIPTPRIVHSCLTSAGALKGHGRRTTTIEAPLGTTAHGRAPTPGEGGYRHAIALRPYLASVEVVAEVAVEVVAEVAVGVGVEVEVEGEVDHKPKPIPFLTYSHSRSHSSDSALQPAGARLGCARKSADPLKTVAMIHVNPGVAHMTTHTSTNYEELDRNTGL